jgi:hypothetical protein
MSEDTRFYLWDTLTTWGDFFMTVEFRGTSPMISFSIRPLWYLGELLWWIAEYFFD